MDRKSSRSDRRLAAIDHHRRAGHERRFVRCQEVDDVGDFLGRSYIS